MNPFLRSLLIFTAVLSVGSAQTAMVGVRISTSTSGAWYRVDGMLYRAPSTFSWPLGSKHYLEIDSVQYTEDQRSRYTFTGWADPSGVLGASTTNTLAFTAQPNLPSIVGNVTLEDRVDLQLVNGDFIDNVSSCPDLPGATPDMNSGNLRPGLACINGSCWLRSTQLWLARSSTAALTTRPCDGFVFSGWAINNMPGDQMVSSVTINGPTVLAPHFSPARRVRLITAPAELKVLVNGTTVPTSDPSITQAYPLPGAFDWAFDSSQLLGAPSPQQDKLGKNWVFDSWDFGGGQNTVYKVQQSFTPIQLTARFVRGATITFLTNPTNLKLNVNGRENWPSYNFVWGVGTKNTVTAPAETTDSKGRKYTFKGWSNNGPATQEITVDAFMADDGMRLTANYELLNRTTISSAQMGAKVLVDGVECLLPCTLDRASSSSAQIAALPQVSTGDTTRVDFAGWGDGVTTAARTVSFATDNQKLTLNYRTMVKLSTTSDPAGAAVIAINPPSPDGFYSTGDSVTVTASSNGGYKFRRWAGDSTSSSNIVSLSMNAPRSLVAMFDRVPFLASAAVKNAAGITPNDTVAPGSIISIFGANLAQTFEIGPASPLAQALGGVTARIGTRLLPLLFVSPDQINALLPSDVAEGEQTIYVRTGLLPEISTKFRVERNAPGLFNTAIEDKTFVLAAHEDGSPVTVDKPAKRGEKIKIFGTGFGPFDRPVVDGFALPSLPAYVVADDVEVILADQVVTQSKSIGEPGAVGLNTVTLPIADETPGGGSINLKVRINGRESNSVLLPVE